MADTLDEKPFSSWIQFKSVGPIWLRFLWRRWGGIEVVLILFYWRIYFGVIWSPKRRVVFDFSRIHVWGDSGPITNVRDFFKSCLTN
jgi:hypothetical protein